MTFFITFILATSPGGFSILFLLLKKKKIDEILLKQDSSYANNSILINFLKIIKAYKGRFLLSKKEKRLLSQSTICFIVAYVTIITWGILSLFFPDILFGIVTVIYKLTCNLTQNNVIAFQVSQYHCRPFLRA